MSDILSILADNGLTVQAITSGRGIDPIVRDTYKELNNGAEYVYVFGSDASDDLLALLAGADEVTDGKAVVLHDNEYDATTLRRKVNYRNLDNVDKSGKPRANVTLGKVSISQMISDGSGFVVRAA